MEGKAKTIALVGFLVLLIGLAAYMWWPESSTPPAPPDNLPSGTDQPAPSAPGQPNSPDAPPPPANQPPIISG